MKNILQIIVFSVHVSTNRQIAPITSSNWVDFTIKAIEHVSTQENILFYSRDQLAILSQEAWFDKVLLTGGFGVGKSFLLAQKAISISQDPIYTGKIVYICFFEHFDGGSLFFHNTRLHLEPHGIEVFTSITTVSTLKN